MFEYFHHLSTSEAESLARFMKIWTHQSCCKTRLNYILAPNRHTASTRYAPFAKTKTQQVLACCYDQCTRQTWHTWARSNMTAARWRCCFGERVPWKPCVRKRCCLASCRTMAAATEMFRDCEKPIIGIITLWSAASKASLLTPSSSLPKITAEGFVQSTSCVFQQPSLDDSFFSVVDVHAGHSNLWETSGDVCNGDGN